MIVEKYVGTADFPLTEYVRFMREVFSERLRADIRFVCASYSADDFKRALKGAHTVIVRDSVQGGGNFSLFAFTPLRCWRDAVCRT